MARIFTDVFYCHKTHISAVFLHLDLEFRSILAMFWSRVCVLRHWEDWTHKPVIRAICVFVQQKRFQSKTFLNIITTFEHFTLNDFTCSTEKTLKFVPVFVWCRKAQEWQRHEPHLPQCKLWSECWTWLKLFGVFPLVRIISSCLQL